MNASSSIRDHRARVVTLIVPLSSLRQRPHEAEKFIRLCGHRYNPVNDTVELVADSCPLRRQNQSLAEYLLTALYHESRKIEAWEATKENSDKMSCDWMDADVSKILNEGENKESLEAYKLSVKKHLNL